MAVLLVSAELDEVLALSDRVAVIYEGRIQAVLSIEEASREKVGLLMAGDVEAAADGPDRRAARRRALGDDLTRRLGSQRAGSRHIAHIGGLSAVARSSAVTSKPWRS